jgi:hypothetical protein
MPTAPLPPPSSAAQHLYAAAKNDILQVRSLLKSGRTQSSVGSGFLIGTSNLVLTNYHVVSQFALDPDTYVGEWVDTGGQRGNVELLAVDVLHDLAVLRVNRNGTGFFKMPEQLARLTQGQYLYSMGNPLDLGFAISEGAYNGVIARSFYDQLMFTGPINSGMSGGPSVTADGAVAGVNVSKRLDGELVSFLVPARYAQDLLKKVGEQQSRRPLYRRGGGPAAAPPDRDGQPAAVQPAEPEADGAVPGAGARVRSRCAAGAAPTSRPTSRSRWTTPAAPWNRPSSSAARCRRGRSASATSSCAAPASTSCASPNWPAPRSRTNTSAATRMPPDRPQLHRRFRQEQRLPLRAVLCVRAYRKFAGLYDFALLTASTDQGLMSLQSRSMRAASPMKTACACPRVPRARCR